MQVGSMADVCVQDLRRTEAIIDGIEQPMTIDAPQRPIKLIVLKFREGLLPNSRAHLKVVH